MPSFPAAFQLGIFQPYFFPNIYDYSFLNITSKTFTFFSIWYINWSYLNSIEFCVHLFLIRIKDSKILFCLNCSNLCSYLLTLALFASILCLSFPITAFNLFLSNLYLSFNSLNLWFFFNPSSPLDSLSRKLTTCLSLYISPLILCFHLSSFFFQCSAFLNPIHSATNTLEALIKLLVSVMLLSFKYLITLLTPFESSKPSCPLS